ncbi:MAG: amidohydrolase family protein [Phycisphaerae bacterium]|nr:amidohydrolase family protein [Phycisphaerae bacterium]
MIVDCHTKVWDSPAWLGGAAPADEVEPAQADAAHHLEAVDPVDHAIVHGLKSRYLGAEIPNDFVSKYVQRYSSKMIGFAGIDPTDPDCLTNVRIAQEDLNLKGVTIAPAIQGFHPADTHAMRVYEACVQRGLPLFIEQYHRSPSAKMEFARPMLVDEIAREFPGLRIVLTHLGFPWVEETIAVLGKHKYVYADVAGILRRPWLAYNALLGAHEYGVMDKLLFGSDFPYRMPAAGIETLYSVNQVSHGTNLITIPREQLRGVVERDALTLLGIDHPRANTRPKPKSILPDDD